MYNIPPPDTSLVWQFMSMGFNFVWPYLAIFIAVGVLSMIVAIAIGIFKYLQNNDDEY